MSQQLVAHSIHRASASTVSHVAKAARSHLVHPGLSIKSSQWGIAHASQLAASFRPSSTAAASALYTERMTTNVGRLYARRLVEFASLSAATQVAVTNLEELIEKPSEWGTIDLEKQRKEFGETISSLGKTKVSRVWAAGSRIFNLALIASPLTVLVPIAYLTGPNSKPTQYTWDYAIWGVEKAGPTFIKLIQWATTRNDLFSPEFVSKFSTLQDHTRGHPWKDTHTMLTKELGEGYQDIFEFDKSTESKSFYRSDPIIPVGSGCVAQVYKAKLKQGSNLTPAGTEVAVKVAHPGILHKVCVDFYILNKLTSLLEKIPYLNLDYLSMKDSVSQFRDIMLPQLDMRVEARNIKRFRKNFSDDPNVAFPAPLDNLTSANVLVESFVHGDPVMKFVAEGHRTDREELAKIGLSTVMKMIFLHDFVHGDLHPGNIIVDRNTEAWGSPLRLNMIDCGLVVEMGEQDHVNLVKVLGAFIKKDGILAGQLMIDTAKKCQATEKDMDLFCKGIQQIVDDDMENNFLESVGDYVTDICYMACKHQVKLEASFINAALACEIMEGLASKLYPTLAVQSIALPMVFKAEVMHDLKELKSGKKPSMFNLF